MELAVLNTQGQETGRKVTLSEAVFGVEANDHAIYLDVKQYLADQRQGTHKTKQRNEVAGSTRKLKRQKGTGGARCGSILSPLFPGGGRVFGPQPRDYRFKLNKKLKQLARRSALTYKAQAGAISVIENVMLEAPKTKSRRGSGRCAEGSRQEGAGGSSGVEHQPSDLVPQHSERDARSGAEPLHLRRDERFGHRDGGGRRAGFEYDVSLKTQVTMNIIIKPVLTEKMTIQGEKLNRYGFIVDVRANKLQIRNAVEQMYNVVVTDVNTVNYMGKLKSRYTKAGLLEGRANNFKKAIVTLKDGDKIDFYSNI